jgi:hypothetical protein
MPSPIEKFIADLRADPAFGDRVADEMLNALNALDIEGDGNTHALVLHAAFEWILEQPRTAREKYEAIGKIVDLPRGRVHIASMREFLNW